MKTRINFITVVFLLLISFSYGQRGSSTQVTAVTYDISDNLDLQAVASVFGESRNLEDFEKRLNDPSLQLSNLDLNEDGYVDYLRVIEVAEGNNRIIVIQSVLGHDQFQDVATIEIERRRSNSIHIQIVGNEFIYGPNYIYEPYYYRRPIFFDYFWSSNYSPYYSPWYWGYYPTYYTNYHVIPSFRYYRRINNYIDTRNRYVYTDSRSLNRARSIYSDVSRSTYQNNYPDRNFYSRNNLSSGNRYLLDSHRSNFSSYATSSRGSSNASNGSRSVGSNYSSFNNSKGYNNSSRQLRSSSRSYENDSNNLNSSNRNYSNTSRPTTTVTRSNPSSNYLESSKRTSESYRNSARGNSNYYNSASNAPQRIIRNQSRSDYSSNPNYNANSQSFNTSSRNYQSNPSRSFESNSRNYSNSTRSVGSSSRNSSNSNSSNTTSSRSLSTQ